MTGVPCPFWGRNWNADCKIWGWRAHYTSCGLGLSADDHRNPLEAEKHKEVIPKTQNEQQTSVKWYKCLSRCFFEKLEKAAESTFMFEEQPAKSVYEYLDIQTRPLMILISKSRVGYSSRKNGFDWVHLTVKFSGEATMLCVCEHVFVCFFSNA